MTAGSVAVPRVIPLRIPPAGKAKHEIDTSTPVEITSDTPGATIYYTLDGSRPEVARRRGFGESSALTYATPVCLPQGRVCVRALAVARDGRESAVVTKIFLVESVPSNDAPSSEDHHQNLRDHLKDHHQNLRDHLEDHHQNLSTHTEGGESSGSPGAPRFLSRRLSVVPLSVVPPVESTSSARRSLAVNASLEDSPFRSLTSTQMSRILRETDFLRCARCLSPRPADPFTRFCLQCGTAVPPLPGHRLPPTEGGQMGLCVYCKALVPMNTPTCIVCEAPIGPQLQPQARLRLQDKIICPSCGTGNPGHISSCVTCEARLPPLPPTAVLSDQSAPPPLPSGENKMASCSKCDRLNHSDARFCDWCGTKSAQAVVCLRCGGCGGSSPPHASFCGFCGGRVPGGNHRGRCGARADDLSLLASRVVLGGPRGPAPPVAPPPRTDRHTQTSGLFYPSSAALVRTAQRGALERGRQQQARDRRTLLTATSPGRGYWRRQVDHVCAHLRSFTQNNTEFRALMGEPRMGRMVSAVIEEDNYEVSLRINFVSARHEETKGGGAENSAHLSESQNLSSVMEGRSVQSTSPTNPGVEKAEALRRTLKMAKPTWASGAGHTRHGAESLYPGSDGRPALAAAVLSGRHDVIPVLVQEGADINQQSGLFNNTALHEAAGRGRRGLLCAETLLGCNASIRKKNGRGQTAYDLAVQSQCSPMISLIAARMGQGLLDRLTQPRTNPGLTWD